MRDTETERPRDEGSAPVPSGLTRSPACPTPSLRATVGPSLLGAAFTLVELIISIGLVLIIMLGVNFVFKMTSDTITAGQALNSAVRDHRAAQAVLQDDFSKYAPDGPALLLRSTPRLAFRNRADQDGDTDYNEGNTQVQRDNAIATFDIDGDGTFTSAGEIASAALPGQRSHRVDIFSYFAKGKFRRATGGDAGRNPASSNTADPTAPLVSDMTSNEAWIWYGHLVLPDNNGSFSGSSGKFNPGREVASTNHNNFFASQWTLGRLSHLLVEPYDHDANAGTPNVVLDKYTGSAKQVFISRGSVPPASVQPFSAQSPARFEGLSATVQRGGQPIELLDARYDLIGSSMATFRNILLTATPLSAPPSEWWDEMMLATRFETNPALVRPITAGTVAAQAPIFMQNCTQFIVEYAGDFLAQDNDPTSANFGNVTGAFVPGSAGADGEVDFVVLNRGTPSQRKITRWYGLPRDTNGDASVPRPTSAANANNCPDVLPLRDLLAAAGAGPAVFEKDVATELPPQTNYVTGMTFAHRYTCAWGPSDINRPKLIRLVITTDDPSGRLPDGQTYEYVFSLPPAE